MSPAHVLEPTYRRLKRDLMDGVFPMGARLEALRLAEELGVSMTPVRDSLNQLTGEGLVEFSPGDGFRAARLNDQDLRDMLHVHNVLLVFAVNFCSAQTIPCLDQPTGDDHAVRLATVFGQIAVSSANRFLARSVARIGERLHPVRRIEPSVISSATELLLALEASLGGTMSERLEAIEAYHASCLEAVPRLTASVSDLT